MAVHYFYQILIFLGILNQEEIDAILQQSDLSDMPCVSDDDWPVQKKMREVPMNILQIQVVHLPQ